MPDRVLTFTKIHESAIIPSYAHIGDSGMDLSSVANLKIPAQSHIVVPTGLTMTMPPGYEGQIRSRSGLAAKHGVFVLNSPGTIDQGYTGELKVILFNTSTIAAFEICVGDRIAQLCICPIAYFTDRSIFTTRGDGGFGSTGV